MAERSITPEEQRICAELIGRARSAMAAADAFDQATVDRLCRAIAWAGGNEKTAIRLANMSVDETGMGGREPTRRSVTGDTLNPNAALGLAHGKAADNSATWGSMFKSQVERCWKKPYGGLEAQMTEAVFSIKLKRDGTLETTPTAISNPSTPYFRVYQESALRAIIECQPYNLPAAYFEEWKFFEPVFTERKS